MATLFKEWVVRVKPDGVDRSEEFLKYGIVAIGWPKMGALTGCGRGKIQAEFDQHYPNYSRRSAGQHVGNIDRFVNCIKVGDIVIVPKSSGIRLATATKEYYYDVARKSRGYPHCIKVRYGFGGHIFPWGKLPPKLQSYQTVPQPVFQNDYAAVKQVINNPDQHW
ncbi:MAG: hypothetical protein MPK31_07145 [Gammaproteobacteria bacterium]|nr:hypothetical protein [Gammaproteobacteria bacterium]MDA8002587.1 hypothetical protein [Alphaproteobacteria bacterium]